MENLATPPTTGIDIAQHILKTIMRYRRAPKDTHTCRDAACETCQAQYLPLIQAAIRTQSPLYLALPAFPGKSPNTEKVFGHLPDQGELLALTFLHRLCKQIQAIYPPGAILLICSDGRVFSDIIGIRDSDVTAYQNVLKTRVLSYSC